MAAVHEADGREHEVVAEGDRLSFTGREVGDSPWLLPRSDDSGWSPSVWELYVSPSHYRPCRAGRPYAHGNNEASKQRREPVINCLPPRAISPNRVVDDVDG